MFMELGMKIDNLIQEVLQWNTQRIWYKPYTWRFISKKIKTKAFKSDESFNIFMNAVKNNKQIWNWQYELLCKMYKGE